LYASTADFTGLSIIIIIIIIISVVIGPARHRNMGW
jgi:Sec-independent protein translocase protein TatA